ncbi:MAG: hypothetical protein HC906_05090 [Bacteroidales bacterium]|nr:hypothetical protein [Bacteroidales bacterium]
MQANISKKTLPIKNFAVKAENIKPLNDIYERSMILCRTGQKIFKDKVHRKLFSFPSVAKALNAEGLREEADFGIS